MRFRGMKVTRYFDKNGFNKEVGEEALAGG